MNLHTLTSNILGLALCLAASICNAQDIEIGRAVFGSLCSRCHGLPPSLLHGADIAAGDPSRIDSALARVRTMGSLRERLSEQDMRDISAYLDSPSASAPMASDDVERLFVWVQWKYQTVLQPRTRTQPLLGYLVRHYAKAGLYLAVSQGQVWLFEEARPENGIQPLGILSTFLEQAKSDGF